MRIFLFLSITVAVFFSGTYLFAENDIDGPKKTIVFRFADRAAAADKASDLKKAKVQTESFEFLSLILPSNLKREIGESGQFAVELSDEILAFSYGKDEAAIIEGMKLVAEKTGASFVVAGSFEVVRKTLSIDCYIYAYKANKLIPVSLKSEKLGAMIDTTISELSSKIATEMDRYIVKRAGTPVILPEENRFDRYFEFSISPKNEGDEVWYTTNGDEPVRGKDSLFTAPFRVRSSSTIKAIGYREGLYVSKSAAKEVTIDRPLARLTVTQTFGTMFFIGTMRDDVEDGEMLSYHALFEFANFQSLKERPFVNNLGISFDYFTGNVKLKDTSMSMKGYLLGGLAGPVYTSRFADFASIDFGVHCGVMRAVTIRDDGGNGWKDIFGIPARQDNKETRFAYGAHMRINFFYKRLVVHGDAGFLRVHFPHDKMNAVTLGAGLGVRL
jgi:hypothetical protein